MDQEVRHVKVFRKPGWILLLALLLAVLIPVTAFANAAEPPSFSILVYGAGEDLTLELQLPDGTDEKMLQLSSTERDDLLWETYFRFFLYRPYGKVEGLPGDGLLKVTGGGETFTCAVPQEALSSGYQRAFVLDLKTRTLREGTGIRGPLLVVLRIVLTLLIEGLVLFLFGFRQRRSWIVFLLTNLVTQGLLNFLLLGGLSSLHSSYHGVTFFFLCIAEAFIFLVEFLVYACTFKEHRKWRILLAAFTANAASLVLGGLILSYLPF